MVGLEHGGAKYYPCANKSPLLVGGGLPGFGDFYMHTFCQGSGLVTQMDLHGNYLVTPGKVKDRM